MDKRSANGGWWLGGALLVAAAALAIFYSPFKQTLADWGVPPAAALLLLGLAVFAGVWVLRLAVQRTERGQ